MPAAPDRPSARRFANQQSAPLLVALLFLTRLRVPGAMIPADASPMAATWCFPLAGGLIGAAGAGAAIAASWCGLPDLAVGLAGIAATAMITGALHEDGLADTADGFGGGSTREQKLEIMRDSRIGSYGTLALIVVTLLRASAIGTLAAEDYVAVLGGMAAAHALARASLPALMWSLSPARRDGLAASVGRPPARHVLLAAFFGVGIAVATLGPVRGAAACGAAIVAAVFAGALARREIGGYTGDVLGAAEQLGEAAVLLAAASAW